MSALDLALLCAFAVSVIAFLAAVCVAVWLREQNAVLRRELNHERGRWYDLTRGSRRRELGAL